jgi:hypothetical protein
MMGSILVDPDVPANKSSTLINTPRLLVFEAAIGAAALAALGPADGPPAAAAAVQQFRRILQGFNMQVIWGANDMIPWLFDHDGWKASLLKGNGLRDAGPIKTKDLINMVGFDPYSSFIRLLQGQTDLLVFHYDWRLSNDETAGKLETQIKERWWKGGLPADIASDQERITIIVHSMGGLVARHFIEALNGYRLVKKLITVGTPHLGAPIAYANYRGSELPLPLSKVIRPAHIMRVLFPFVPKALASRLPAIGVGLLMPAQMQIELMRSYASAIQLLPTYSFATGPGGPETPSVSYAGMTQLPTGRSVVSIMDLARGSLIGLGQFPFRTPNNLDSWLAGKVTYHTLAGTGVSKTAQGYRKSDDRALTDSFGDGTVPLGSAQLPSSAASSNIRRLPSLVSGVDHQDLFKSPIILNYCLSELGLPVPASPEFQLETGRYSPFMTEREWAAESIELAPARLSAYA